VDQRDQDGIEDGYYIDAVDTVAHWELVGCMVQDQRAAYDSRAKADPAPICVPHASRLTASRAVCLNHLGPQ
jgi:hypothetical protein